MTLSDDLTTAKQMTGLIRDAIGFALAEKNIPRAPQWTLLVPQHLEKIDAALDRVEAEIARLRRELTAKENQADACLSDAEAAEVKVARLRAVMDNVADACRNRNTAPDRRGWISAEWVLDWLTNEDLARALLAEDGAATENTISEEGAVADDEWKLTLETVQPHAMCCAECRQARERVARLRDGLRALANSDGIVRAGDPTGTRIPPHEFARALLAEDCAARTPPWDTVEFERNRLAVKRALAENDATGADTHSWEAYGGGDLIQSGTTSAGKQILLDVPGGGYYEVWVEPLEPLETGGAT